MVPSLALSNVYPDLFCNMASLGHKKLSVVWCILCCTKIYDIYYNCCSTSIIQYLGKSILRIGTWTKSLLFCRLHLIGILSQKQKGHQGGCPYPHWGCWSLSSTSPVTSRAVILMTFPIPWLNDSLCGLIKMSFKVALKCSVYNIALLVKQNELALKKLLLTEINSLWPSDAIWLQRSRSTLVQVMACCLTAPSHYLNQCWLIITKAQ